MNFWYSGELDSEIYDAYVAVRRIVESRLKQTLSDRSYGRGVTKIAITAIILGPRFPNHPERRLLQRKQCSADYRLHIDFESFLNGDASVQQQLLIRNTIQAIVDISRKANDAHLEFDGEALANDILAVFALTHKDLARYDKE